MVELCDFTPSPVRVVPPGEVHVQEPKEGRGSDHPGLLKPPYLPPTMRSVASPRQQQQDGSMSPRSPVPNTSANLNSPRFSATNYVNRTPEMESGRSRSRTRFDQKSPLLTPAGEEAALGRAYDCKLEQVLLFRTDLIFNFVFPRPQPPDRTSLPPRIPGLSAV